MAGRGIAAALLVCVLTGGCGKSKPRLIVASKNSTEEIILAEIAAEHLENRLKRKVERQFNAGPTAVVFQELQSGDIGFYPDYTGVLESSILHEMPSQESGVVFERVRSELRRTSRIDTLSPLGIDNRYVMVVRTEDAQGHKLQTLSQAAQSDQRWKLGITVDFEERLGGLAALNAYHLPLGAPARSMDTGDLYRALLQQQVTMIVANATDSQLLNPVFKVLEDDRNVFAPHQACFLVREDLLAADPQVRTALEELSGKFTNEVMQKMNANVDNDHRQTADVAAGFLQSAGLK